MRRFVRPFFFVSTFVIPIAAGCGGSGEETRPTPAAPAASPIPGPPKPWAEMGKEERKSYMEATVVPHMKPIFQAHDPDFFGDFGCPTCHGRSAEDGTYSMPNQDIHKLYPTGSAEQKKLVQEEPEWLRFMIGKVVPNMQGLLGAPAYDPATKTGFTCFYCHPKGESGMP